MDAAEQKLVSDVETHGWHVMNVMEDEEGPGFAYSIGLTRSLGHPEILVVGLPRDTMHSLINLVGEEVRQGGAFKAGATYEQLLEGYHATFRAIPKDQYRNYLGFARWFYDGDDFPALQLIYPDREGRWPWDPQASAGFRAQQPVLADEGDPPWASRPAI